MYTNVGDMSCLSAMAWMNLYFMIFARSTNFSVFLYWQYFLFFSTVIMFCRKLLWFMDANSTLPKSLRTYCVTVCTIVFGGSMSAVWPMASCIKSLDKSISLLNSIALMISGGLESIFFTLTFTVSFVETVLIIDKFFQLPFILMNFIRKLKN